MRACRELGISKDTLRRILNSKGPDGEDFEDRAWT